MNIKPFNCSSNIEESLICKGECGYMITNFELINESTRESVTFGQRDGYDYLFKDGDIDWGSVTVQHNTYSHPGQVGENISNTEIGSRDISITGYCYYIPKGYELVGLNREQAIDFVHDKINKKKTAISRAINPSNYIRMVIGDYYIIGKPSSNVIFGKTEQDNNEYFCKFLISLFCGKPTFATVVPSTTSLRLSKPRFHFPLVFPQGKGYVFGVLYGSSVIVVDNFGTINVGCIITIKFGGVAKNLKLNNITTGEQIVINKSFSTGETIVVNTNDNDDRGIVGYIDGEEKNYFEYWDYRNDWFDLPIGSSTIGFEIEEGNRSDVEISIAINPSKYELEEM